MPTSNPISKQAEGAYGQQLIVLKDYPAEEVARVTAKLAADTGRPLQRVDLSGVVSKYIGETEKNLQALFEQAAETGAVLLFDEADALFGKRTETGDAHDRYANRRTDYLLQQLGRYPGLVVVATRKPASMKKPFLRRYPFTRHG